MRAGDQRGGAAGRAGRAVPRGVPAAHAAALRRTARGARLPLQLPTCSVSCPDDLSISSGCIAGWATKASWVAWKSISG
jgi:hypothetical protein